MVDEKFFADISELFHGHRDALYLIVKLVPRSFSFSYVTGVQTHYFDDEPRCALPANHSEWLELKRYALNVRTFLRQWRLDRLSEDRGYFEVHSYLIGTFCDLVRFGKSDQILGGDGLDAIGDLPIVGDIVGDRTSAVGGRSGRNLVIRPRVSVELINEWRARDETRKDAEKRLTKEFARLLRQELNRLTSMYEAKDYVFSDTTHNKDYEIDWFFRRFVLGHEVTDIARDSFKSEGTIRNRTNALAGIIGFDREMTRKRTV